MIKPYRGHLDIVERLQEKDPSLARIWQDREDAAREIEDLRRQVDNLSFALDCRNDD